MSSDWYRLNCACPACGEGKKSNWYHSEDLCCSTNGWLYINAKCNIKCDECYSQKNMEPSFILGWRFTCEKHQGEYRKADEIQVCNAISYICTNNNVPRETRKEMINIINNHMI